MTLVFVVALSACSKDKPPVETDPEPIEDLSTDTPDPEVDEDAMDGRDVESEPMEAIPVLEDVFFDFDKAELSSSAKRALEKNARQLKDASSYTITIEGHCDERGTASYNLALGERRAKAAASFLRSLGVSSSRVKTVSYGEERPFDSGGSESAWAKNRRAHFIAAKN
jgi:peptidoglycan-associated lipoprotein